MPKMVRKKAAPKKDNKLQNTLDRVETFQSITLAVALGSLIGGLFLYSSLADKLSDVKELTYSTRFATLETNRQATNANENAFFAKLYSKSLYQDSQKKKAKK